MNQNKLQEPLDWPATSEVYERAFIRTVLSLYGIAGAPSAAQLEKARKILRLHGVRTEMIGFRQSAMGESAARSRLSQPAGVEHAFLFVRFESVSPPDAAQVSEFNDWLAQANLHGRNPQVSVGVAADALEAF